MTCPVGWTILGPMEIVRPAPVPASLAPLMELDERLARRDREAILPSRAARMAPLLPAHPFRRFGEVIPLAVRAGGRIAGRIAVFIDRRLDGEIGWFGGLAAEDDRAVVRALVDAAAGELGRRGVRRMLGPVDGTIWHASRIQLEGARAPRWSMEPGYPEALIGHLLDAGLEPVRRYVGYFHDRFTVQAGQVAAAGARAADAGYRIRSIEPARMGLEMDVIRRLANTCFVDSLGFVPLSRAEFVGLFGPLARAIDPTMVLLAEDPSGEACGFLLTYPDPTAALRVSTRRLGWLRAARALQRSGSIVFKTLAVHPDHRRAGLAAALSARALAAGAARAAARGGGALFQGFFDEGNDPSVRASRTALIADEPAVRRYAILGRSL